MNLAYQLPNLVELRYPIREGDLLADRRVLEVIRLESTCTIAGYDRAIFVAVHEKDPLGRMLTMFVAIGETQEEWAMPQRGTEDGR